MAIWEMTSLLIAPKKVFKSIYYHVSTSLLMAPCPIALLPAAVGFILLTLWSICRNVSNNEFYIWTQSILLNITSSEGSLGFFILRSPFDMHHRN